MAMCLVGCNFISCLYTLVNTGNVIFCFVIFFIWVPSKLVSVIRPRIFPLNYTKIQKDFVLLGLSHSLSQISHISL